VESRSPKPTVALPGAPRPMRGWLALVLPGLGSMSAAMPALLLGPLASAVRQDFPFSSVFIGFGFAAFYLASALSTGIGGWLVGKLGSIYPLRIGLLFTAALAGVFAMADSAFYLVAAAAAAGVINGLLTAPINLMIMRLVKDRFRGLAFGVKVSGVPAAASVAAVGAWLTSEIGWNWRALYGCSAALSLSVAGLTFLLHARADRAAANTGALRDGPHLPAVHPSLSLVLLAVAGLLATSGTAIFPAFVVTGLEQHGVQPAAAAGLLALGAGLGIVSRVLVGGISDRWREPLRHLWTTGGMFVVAAASMLGLAFATTEVLLGIATVLGFAVGTGWPGLIHHAVIVTHPRSPAVATSWMQSGTYVGAVIGPLTFGLLADGASFTAAWSTCAGGLIAAAGALFLGVSLLHRKARATQPARDHAARLSSP
jgi:predicted MFS family arabinose efflux permease